MAGESGELEMLHDAGGWRIHEAGVARVAWARSAWLSSAMDRVGNKARGFDQARHWEYEQYAAMTPDQRREVARALRERVYGERCPDVRDAVAGLKRRRRP